MNEVAGRKGGIARAAKLTAEQRKRIATEAARARWARYRKAKGAETGIGLGFRTLPGETMRQTVERYSARHGLQRECLSYYDSEIAAGQSEANAALYALHQWDVLDIVDLPKK